MNARTVFLSYASDDRAFAAQIRDAVAQRGAEAVDADSVVQPGSDVGGAAMEALRSADLFVFVVPEKEGSGRWALMELGAAKALGKRIVALMPDRHRAGNSEVAVRLSDVLVLDAGEKPATRVAEQLLSAVNG